ncbi:MAG: FAD-binding and (Fe-S)-binding domain-containing protein [Halobacteriales archaeon]
MATDPNREHATTDPKRDPRTNYDYAGGATNRPALVEDLEGLVDGDVRFDDYSRELYATDASIYEVTPVGVVFPVRTADVAAVVEYCAERGIPVLPRGGGTSLAGQAVNEAVVLDFTRHMTDLVAIDPERRQARAQPGTYLGDLNAALEPHGLKFAPDPAWGDKSALGGAIGNNSTGAHSLNYGKTDAYVRECEVVLADGTVTTFGEVSLSELRERADPDGDLEARIYAEVNRILQEERAEVESRYPDLKRNVSGYNLDWLVAESEGGSVNLARLLCGSEGSLAVVTEAEIALEPVPETKAMALLSYEDLIDAMEDVAPILEHDPAAVEVLDDVLIDLARDTEEFGGLVESMLPAEAGAVLLVEFYADSDSDGETAVADLLADRLADASPEAASGEGAGTVTGEPRRAIEALEAHDDEERERFWKLRKSGLPILLSRTSDAKHVAFVEDTAVPPANLPEYVADMQEVLSAHDTEASFYAHAGPGVLHIRPLVNTKTEAGVEAMESIADEVTDLVIEYGGSVSGEHGDGRARTGWNEKLYGADLWETFRGLKNAFDPDWLLNPGQVVSPPESPTDMTENLRFDPDYDFDAGFDSELAWDNENGMQGMVELCHGCGGCRGPQETTGGVMCPTYRAAEEEITSTRGRANMLRQAMSGDLPEGVDNEFMHEVLDLCIGCKGCAKNCPSEVDMAKLKAEVTHEHHQEHGVSLRDRVFANVARVSAVGSALAPLSNWAQRLPGAGWLAEKTLGIARERDLPAFHRDSFRDWFERRESGLDSERTDQKAVLVPDPYTNYTHPAAGTAAVRTLEAAGVALDVATHGDTGRPAFSKGRLDLARERGEALIDELAPRVADGWDVVAIEPSDAVMLQSDYADLLEGSRAAAVMGASYGVCEYLDVHGLADDLPVGPSGESLTYHGHCHQKATLKDGHAASVLRTVGYDVDELDSGCCGMAGSFGYEAEHYSMSKAIAGILYDQVDASGGESVVAPGASCRTQLSDHAGEKPPHPIEKVAETLS